METLKKSGIDFDHLRQSSLGGSRGSNSIADNASDYARDESRIGSADTSPDRNSRSERSPGRESTGHESLSERSRRVTSPSAPDYTQEYDDDDDVDGGSVIGEELETEVA